MSQGKSVGALVKNSKGEYLVQYRLVNPTGLAMPAGHIDGDELPHLALKREIYEETGLFAESFSVVFHGYINSPCGKGHDGHEWWVYLVMASGEPELKESAKHKFLKFMSPKEMRPYIERREYDPAWFEHILPKLGII